MGASLPRRVAAAMLAHLQLFPGIEAPKLLMFILMPCCCSITWIRQYPNRRRWATVFMPHATRGAPAADFDTARLSDPHPELHTPAAGSPHAPSRHEPPHPALRRASPILLRHSRGWRYPAWPHKELLEPDVLVLQWLQPPSVRHVQSAILGLPLVKDQTADAVLAKQVRRSQTRL